MVSSDLEVKYARSKMLETVKDLGFFLTCKLTDLVYGFLDASRRQETHESERSNPHQQSHLVS